MSPSIVLTFLAGNLLGLTDGRSCGAPAVKRFQSSNRHTFRADPEADPSPFPIVSRKSIPSCGPRSIKSCHISFSFEQADVASLLPLQLETALQRLNQLSSNLINPFSVDILSTVVPILWASGFFHVSRVRGPDTGIVMLLLHARNLYQFC
jgi:hypothetical protein